MQVSNSEQQYLPIGTKIGCYTIIAECNSYPDEPISDRLVKANLDKQIEILQKKKNGELPQDYKIVDKYVCRCHCGKQYFLSKEKLLLLKSHRYCSDECFTEIVYDKDKFFDVDFTNTTHEALNILECVDNHYEYSPWLEKTRGKRIKHIRVCRKYKCQCSLCGQEYTFKSTDFEIKNDDYGRNADKGYYSDACCKCHKISSFQWRTISIFNKYNIKYKVEVSFPDLTGDTRLLRYDFAILNDDGSIKCLIECQGIQHRKPVEEFGGKSQFEHQVKNDNLKREYAKKNNMTLIEIPDTCNTFDKEMEFLKDTGIIQKI